MAVFTDITAEAKREKERLERVKNDVWETMTAPRRFARWAILDRNSNVVETFPFNDRAGAERRAAELDTRNKFADERRRVVLKKMELGTF